jgi:hypothetical protein
MQSLIQMAEEAIPRSSENIALAIGALCLVRILYDSVFFSRFHNFGQLLKEIHDINRTITK